jgi:hypothetical protein
MILILGARKHEEKRGKIKFKNDTSIGGNGKEKTGKQKIKNDTFPKAWERRKGWK